MPPLATPSVLAAWEQGRALPPYRRALLLLSAVQGGTLEQLAELAIGERDARLLHLREWAFGPTFQALAECPACGETLELSFDVADIRLPVAAQTDSLTTRVGAIQLRLRPPTSVDLAAAAQQPDAAAGRLTLLARCLVQAEQVEPPAVVQDFADLPAEVLDAAEAAIAELAGQANVQIKLACAACGQTWLAQFDIESYFWSEIDAWAQRTLREVHALARAYGWSEAEILALSPQRRQTYLEIIHQDGAV